MADEALSAIAQGLRAEALTTNQRRALVLSGPADWALNAARSTPAARPKDQGKTVWLSNRDLPEPHLPATAGDRLLGTELDTLVYDAHGGLDSDSLGAALGALCGGGLLILLAPDLDAWPALPDPLAECRAPQPIDAAAPKPSRLLRRLVRVLIQAPGVTLIRARGPLPPLAPPPEPRRNFGGCNTAAAPRANCPSG